MKTLVFGHLIKKQKLDHDQSGKEFSNFMVEEFVFAMIVPLT